jgi:hypothetical protein
MKIEERESKIEIQISTPNSTLNTQNYSPEWQNYRNFVVHRSYSIET